MTRNLVAQTESEVADGYQGHSGYLHNANNAAVTFEVEPYGDAYAAALITTNAPDNSSEVIGDKPSRIAVSKTYASLNATALTGKGASGVFSAVFTAAGALDTIKATTGGSGYLVGDKLRIAVPTNKVAKDTKVASLNVTTAVSGDDGRDVALTITPTSSRATAVLPKVKIQVEADGTITDDAQYAFLGDATGLTTGDTITFDADNNDEGNSYTAGWTFTITLRDQDFTSENVDFRVVPGANKAAATIILPAGNVTPFPVEDYKVMGSTDRKVAVYK